MSRMKIVWGDKDSVPEKWAVDISTDNENWVPWINGDNKSLDNFSLWPAYRVSTERNPLKPVTCVIGLLTTKTGLFASGL